MTVYASTVSAVALLSIRKVFHRIAFLTTFPSTLLTRLDGSTFCADILPTGIACTHGSAFATPTFHWIADVTNNCFSGFYAVKSST
jgi:hypothetical protein